MKPLEKAIPEEKDRTNLRNQAYQVFTRRLLNRALRPGQFISQRELVELTGLTLGAIREVVPRLEAEGLIRTVPQRGMQVAQVDLSLVRQAFQFRLFLEREAIALFTRSVSDEELARLRSEHESILARVGTEQPQKVVDDAQAVDWGLHDTIIDALGNDIISNAYRVNSIKIRLIRQEQTRLDDGLVIPVMKDHLRIIEALEARNPEQASAELTRHIENARMRALGF